MTQMPGVPALTVELTGVRRMHVLHQLGRTLRRIHSIPQAPFYGRALFPGNRTRDVFVERARATLAHTVQVIGETPYLWPLGIAAADLALRVLAALPFVGLIDVGDAYIGHPALDGRWPTHADHLAILQGDCDEAPVTDEFMTTWRSGLVLNDLSALATRPDRRPQALERLHRLLLTFA